MATKKKGQETDTTAKEASARGEDDQVGSASVSKPAAKEDKRAKSENEKESKKERSKDKDSVSLLQSIVNLQQFLKGVLIEFSKISWPSRGQVIQETTTVLCLVTIITVMVLAFDWFLGHAIFGPIEHWARLHGGGLGSGQ